MLKEFSNNTFACLRSNNSSFDNSLKNSIEDLIVTLANIQKQLSSLTETANNLLRNSVSLIPSACRMNSAVNHTLEYSLLPTDRLKIKKLYIKKVKCEVHVTLIKSLKADKYVLFQLRHYNFPILFLPDNPDFYSLLITNLQAEITTVISNNMTSRTDLLPHN